MSTRWKNWMNRLGASVGFGPSINPRSQEKIRPSTYSTPPAHPGVQRAEFFDPALKQFPKAFRVGEPVFSDATLSNRWHEKRETVTDAVLQIISLSPWKQHLVLRGSRLLKAWLPAVARDPGDLDFVVSPASIKVSDRSAEALLAGLSQAILDHHWPMDSRVGPGHAIDDIWTYDRVPGKRLVIPWSAPDLPAGRLQLDLVFGEELLQPPEETVFALGDGSELRLLAASRELSLAWKLQWLETDMYPQGKDLYDAVLLAETVRPPLGVLKSMLAPLIGAQRVNALSPDFPMHWQVDWEDFKREYPWVQGDALEWQRRLTRLLAPRFV